MEENRILRNERDRCSPFLSDDFGKWRPARSNLAIGRRPKAQYELDERCLALHRGADDAYCPAVVDIEGHFAEQRAAAVAA